MKKLLTRDDLEPALRADLNDLLFALSMGMG